MDHLTLRVSHDLYWVEKFSGLQFTVIFRKFFNTILEVDFGIGDSADYKICSLTEKKFFIYPFISLQKDFGYSDATPKNNVKDRVVNLFNQSNEKIQLLEKVSEFYKLYKRNNFCKVKNRDWNKLTIPTYVINLPERKERRVHIQEQFKDKPEFDVTIVEACKHKIGALGLWLSIQKIIKLAIKNQDDVIVICEDDHEFTNKFSKESLFTNILYAQKLCVDLLSGGTAILETVLPITKNLFWINEYYSTQFIVVYKKFFQNILNEPFDKNVVADGLLSEMTANKMIVLRWSNFHGHKIILN